MFLTKQQQLVLAVALALFLAGLAVKVWRAARAPSTVEQAVTR